MTKKFGESGVDILERDIKLYERLNEQLAKENEFLRDEIRFLRPFIHEATTIEMNPPKLEIPSEVFMPLGGYESSSRKAERLSMMSHKVMVTMKGEEDAGKVSEAV